jgi:Domain of unknown function (DUF6285)
MRDLPSGAALLALGRDLIDELLPLVPPGRHRELRLVATAMAIAEREAIAGDTPVRDILEGLAEFYGDSEPGPGDSLLHRLAADLRAGAFDACEMRGRAARAILWRMTMMKLREGNPHFLAQNGFG